MGRPDSHTNQRLANLVKNEQLPIWDKNNVYMYKKICSTLKRWVILESELDSSIF